MGSFRPQVCFYILTARGNHALASLCDWIDADKATEYRCYTCDESGCHAPTQDRSFPESDDLVAQYLVEMRAESFVLSCLGSFIDKTQHSLSAKEMTANLTKYAYHAQVLEPSRFLLVFVTHGQARRRALYSFAEACQQFRRDFKAPDRVCEYVLKTLLRPASNLPATEGAKLVSFISWCQGRFSLLPQDLFAAIQLLTFVTQTIRNDVFGKTQLFIGVDADLFPKEEKVEATATSEDLTLKITYGLRRPDEEIIKSRVLCRRVSFTWQATPKCFVITHARCYNPCASRPLSASDLLRAHGP